MQRITLVGELNSITGYGNHLMQVARCFAGLGIYCSIRATRTVEMFGQKIPADIMAMTVGGIQPESWEVIIAPPHLRPTPGKRTVYFTMWESTRVPGNCVENINLSEMVVTPSDWCRESFRNSGVTKPIATIPLGVGCQFYERAFPPASPFVFCTAGRTAHGRDRKGMDGVVRAFLAAFPYDPHVRLKVKCHADCELPDVSDSRIEVTRSHLQEDQIADWLASAHCFVSGACAEGWGLWQHQACAVGRPVIAAHYGGLREFLGVENSYSVAYRQAASSEHFGGQWAVVDLGSMIQIMRKVRDDVVGVMEMGRLAHATVEALTWDRSCGELACVLDRAGAIRHQRRIFSRAEISHADHAPDKTPSIESQCADRGWACRRVEFPKGKDEACFNPSIASDGRWFVRGSSTEGGNRNNSSIFTIENGIRKNILTGTDTEWFEDPRAIRRDGGYAISYTRAGPGLIATQEIAFLRDDLSVEDTWHVCHGGNGVTPKTAKSAEKNWAWFQHDDDWHFIHWLEPSEIVRVDAGRVQDVFKTSKRNDAWRYGKKHGGSPPVRIGDEYWGFCHSVMPWFGSGRSRYFISAYAFEAKPPFAMTRLPHDILLSSEDNVGGNECSCVIAGSAVLNDGIWTLGVGEMDEQCLEVKIRHSDVLATLDNV